MVHQKDNPDPLVGVCLKFRLSQSEALNELNRRTRIPKAVLFREAVDDYLAKHCRDSAPPEHHSV